MADEHAENGHPHPHETVPAAKPGSGDKNADEFEDFVVKPGIGMGLGYLAYKYLGTLGALAGLGFVSGAAAENLVKNGNINISSNQILENMVTGTGMAAAGAWGLSKASSMPNLGLSGTASALGYSVPASALATGAALAGTAALVAPLIYYPLSHVLSTGKLDGMGADLKKHYLKGLRTIPISAAGIGAAYAGLFALAPYIAIPAALYFLAGYRTALSREDWSYGKAVAMSFAAPIAAAGTFLGYLITGVPKAAFQLANSIYSKGSSLYQKASEGLRDVVDDVGRVFSKLPGTPAPVRQRAGSPAPAAPAHAGAH